MNLPKRKLTRLKGYDYGTPGAYFVTICTHGKQKLFEAENIVGNDLRVVPPPQNAIIHKWLSEITQKYSNMKIDKYVIMPNHIHAIIVITERHTGRSLHGAIQWFKTMTTNAYISGVKENGLKAFHKQLWQKSFHDHIIRDENDYQKIWEYIDTNAIRWEEDCFYTKTVDSGKLP